MPLLEVKSLNGFYGDFQALFDVNLQIEEGQSLAIIGANGAGKSTLLHALMRQVHTQVQQLRFREHSLLPLSPAEVVHLGMALIPEGRRLFRSCSVRENLLLGATAGRPGPWSIPKVLEVFPELESLLLRGAPDLSGGQQQMAAIARALMANPILLLCDELSLGLAPVITKRVYEALAKIKQQGMSIILVEQDVDQALRASDYVYCLMEGRVNLEGSPDALSHECITRAYFGEGG